MGKTPERFLIKHINNIPDFKNENGEWVRDFYTEPYVQNHTRGGLLWKSLTTKTNPKNWNQNRLKPYIDCSNKFESMSHLIEWALTEHGYMLKDRLNRFWALDKDILHIGNKTYSPETCIFVPQHINSLLVGTSSKRGECPVGVNKTKHGRYRAICRIDGDRLYLGTFDTPEEAHYVWQKQKIISIQHAITNDKFIQGHTKLISGLDRICSYIQNDIDNGNPTDYMF